MIFLIMSIIFFNLFCFLVPKRLTWIEIVTTTWFGMFFELIVNVYLDLKYDLYGYFNKGVDWETLIIIFGVFPQLNYLVLNFYPYSKGLMRLLIYLLTWDILAVGYEQLSILAGFFYYNGWKWWYSAIAYPPIILILGYNLRFIRWIISISRSREV
jgi:hypothetical protein